MLCVIAERPPVPCEISLRHCRASTGRGVGQADEVELQLLLGSACFYSMSLLDIAYKVGAKAPEKGSIVSPIVRMGPWDA